METINIKDENITLNLLGPIVETGKGSYTDTYTKAEINTMFANYYTKSEIDAMIGNISTALDAINGEVV